MITSSLKFYLWKVFLLFCLSSCSWAATQLPQQTAWPGSSDSLPQLGHSLLLLEILFGLVWRGAEEAERGLRGELAYLLLGDMRKLRTLSDWLVWSELPGLWFLTTMLGLSWVGSRILRELDFPTVKSWADLETLSTVIFSSCLIFSISCSLKTELLTYLHFTLQTLPSGLLMPLVLLW